MVKISKIVDFREAFCNKLLSQGHETWNKRQIVLIFSKLSLGGGYLICTRNPAHREISWKLLEMLLCAFNVLSVGEETRYSDVRNGVGKLRICTFTPGGFEF